MSDRLIFEAQGRLFGFKTAHVHKILETDRVYFLPGQSGPVSGVVTLSGTPVAVLDTFRLLSISKPEPEKNNFHRIIVLKEKDKILAFDIGCSEVSFVLDTVEPESRTGQTDKKEQTDEERGVAAETAPSQNPTEKIAVRGRGITVIDWLPYFEVTADILSTHRVIG